MARAWCAACRTALPPPLRTPASPFVELKLTLQTCPRCGADYYDQAEAQ